MRTWLETKKMHGQSPKYPRTAGYRYWRYFTGSARRIYFEVL
ncbi:hypothetical protein CFter6_4635 [Collimonas fungivorans]|uniref:Uncharacterized protein n=1 Tax=Collimonas fungivorans TaxID=158899 RepID=A0A127PHE6_9BURK|nr:hypothetical protein CFter6_4635 [Collimonas fungivorans]